MKILVFEDYLEVMELAKKISDEFNTLVKVEKINNREAWNLYLDDDIKTKLIKLNYFDK